jgi:hypothetical protein
MLGQSLVVGVRVAGQGLAGAVLGAAPAAVYAVLVGAVHLAIYGRWGGVPAFALGCVLVGALVGLLAGLTLALTEEAPQHREPRPATLAPSLRRAALLHSAPSRIRRPSWARSHSC